MARYDLLLCDADETLLDLSRAERNALRETADVCGFPCGEEEAAAYSAANLACWKRFERGEMSLAELRVRRFRDFFGLCGIDGDPVRTTRVYMGALGKQGCALPGAAEALARCQVPCRVMSFCSMSGFTILRLFNDYGSADNSGIFDYYTEGCNRDGLAVRAAGELLSQSPCEHRMLLLLSDVKPLDVAKIRKDERDVGVSYDGIRALTDTAHEVRRLRAEGVSVVCLFTGEDADLPDARMVYGQDFVRIRDHARFADAVGKLIVEQLKNDAL